MNSSDFLKAFPSFARGPEILAHTLVTAGQRKIVPGAMPLYHEGDACGAIAFVLAGEIRVFKIGTGGREITLYEIGPGETCILNASCILSGRAYPAHASTLSETVIHLVPSDLFRRLVAEHDAMRDFVFALLSQRLTGVMELVEEVAFGRMDVRLMEYLIEKAGNNRLESTHQKIANDLGTSREVVSRLLKDFERKGEVRLSRNEITLLT